MPAIRQALQEFIEHYYREGNYEVVGNLQGSVKVADSEYIQRQTGVTREVTPHPASSVRHLLPWGKVVRISNCRPEGGNKAIAAPPGKRRSTQRTRLTTAGTPTR